MLLLWGGCVGHCLSVFTQRWELWPLSTWVERNVYTEGLWIGLKNIRSASAADRAAGLRIRSDSCPHASESSTNSNCYEFKYYIPNLSRAIYWLAFEDYMFVFQIIRGIHLDIWTKFKIQKRTQKRNHHQAWQLLKCYLLPLNLFLCLDISV